jgi:Mg-chelatase subunit ChlD
MKRVIFGLACCGALLLGCGSDNKRTSSDGVGDSDDDGELVKHRDAGSAKSDGGKKDASSSSGTTKKDGSTSTTGGGGDCDGRTISAKARPPDILIVLDRSLSMLAARWQPSTTAVKMLTNEFDSTVQFGLMTFPHGNGICDPGVLDVPVAPMNAANVNSFIDMTAPGGFTPTAGTLSAALDALGDRTLSADTTPTPAYVVLVTDGEPDCPGTNTLDPVQGSIDAVTALAKAGIKTYVVGYNLVAGAQLMNQMAQAGGTDKYFEVENQQDLTDAFHQITADVVKCDFELDEVPDDPSYVRVTIDGNTVVLNAADGWVIDGKTVTLQAGSCDMLKDGTKHVLQVKVECNPITYL